MHRVLLITASTIAFAVSAQARAQDAGPAPQGDEKAGLADIVVTATKAETTLQKTPQAITAIDGDDLQRLGVATAQDLNKLVTGLNIETNGSNSAIFIRGIGSRTLSATADPAIAFGVDGVYFARAAGLGSVFFDLERVEAVKGPQGTLYGRNATGGAINIITRRAQIGERSVAGEFEVGNYNAIRAFAAVNLPLGDKVALRIAGQSTYNSGYLSDGYNDANMKAGRLSLTAEPSDDVTITASVDYAAQGGQGPGYVPLGPSTLAGGIATRFIVPDAPFTGPSDPRVNAVIQAAAPATAVPGPTTGIFCRAMVVGAPTPGGIPARPLCGQPLGIAPIRNDEYLDNAFYGANLTLRANLGFATLTAIGGYRATDINTVQRPDINRQLLVARADQYSGELRLASNATDDGRLKWLIGGFYSRETQTSAATIQSNDQAIPVPTTPVFCATPPVAGFCVAAPVLIQSRLALREPDISNTTYAGFGQVTVSLTDGFRVTGGVRFTHEEKATRGASTTLFYTVPAGASRTYPSVGAASFDNTSYRAGIELDVAPRSMIYAHFSTGFHAGGFNFGVETGPNPYYYAPETVQSYVVGIKNRFFDNRLQLNVEGYWLDYKNYQYSSLGAINDGSPACNASPLACPTTVRTDNAPGARIKGVEADLALRLGDNGTLDLNILYNDARYRDFGVRNFFTGVVTSYAGVRLPSANPWTVGVGYTQQFPLADGGRVVASARTQYRSGTYLWYTELPSQYQEGYTRTDLTIGYEAEQERWSLRAFVRNVEGKATAIAGTGVNATTGLFFTVLNPPRTFGAAFAFKL